MSNNIRAGLYMILSMAGFTINDTLIKSLDNALPVSEVMAVRGVILTGFILILLVYNGFLSRIKEVFTPLIGLRASMELMATLAFLTALPLLPFASLSAILQSLPLVVTLGAALVFGEKVGWRRWLAILIGFVGVLIVIRPGSSVFQFASIFMIISVLFAAARDLATRALPDTTPSLLVSCATAVLVALSGVVLTIIQGNWQPINVEQGITLALAAVFLFFGYQFIIMAMRIGEVAYVVPFRYTSLLWAIGLGYLVFDEIPDRFTIIGSVIVVSMGLFTLYREVKLSRNKLSSKTAARS